MRMLVRAIGLLCVIHILALLSLSGWLVGSDRMDADRWHEIVEKLSKTLEEEKQELEMVEGVQQDVSRLIPRVVAQGASASEQLEQQQRKDVEQQRQVELAKQEVETLQRALAAAQTQFERKRADFDAEKKAFEDRLAGIEQQQNDEGFKKTVRLYEALPADQVKEMFLVLIQQNEVDQVVQYLQAMQPRAAGKVLKSFETPGEIQQAVDLTQRLRALGSELAGVAENLG